MFVFGEGSGEFVDELSRQRLEGEIDGRLGLDNVLNRKAFGAGGQKCFGQGDRRLKEPTIAEAFAGFVNRRGDLRAARVDHIENKAEEGQRVPLLVEPNDKLEHFGGVSECERPCSQWTDDGVGASERAHGRAAKAGRSVDEDDIKVIDRWRERGAQCEPVFEVALVGAGIPHSEFSEGEDRQPKEACLNDCVGEGYTPGEHFHETSDCVALSSERKEECALRIDVDK